MRRKVLVLVFGFLALLLLVLVLVLGLVSFVLVTGIGGLAWTRGTATIIAAP